MFKGEQSKFCCTSEFVASNYLIFAIRPEFDNGTVCVTIVYDRSASTSTGVDAAPFAWSDRLNREAAAKVAVALARLQQGNLSNVKGVGAGVYEYRIDFGPGYRIYFGKDGDRLVILVGGEQRHANSRISVRRRLDGKTTRNEKVRRGEQMALTKDFKETIRARVKRDPGFRKALLREGIENFLSGDVETGKIILRDFINATIGFTKLSDVTHLPAKE